PAGREDTPRTRWAYDHATRPATMVVRFFLPRTAPPPDAAAANPGSARRPRPAGDRRLDRPGTQLQLVHRGQLAVKHGTGCRGRPRLPRGGPTTHERQQPGPPRGHRVQFP